MSLTLEQIGKLEQLREQSDANGGRNKATGSNFILYGLYRTAVMDAAPELIQLARAQLEAKQQADMDVLRRAAASTDRTVKGRNIDE